MSYETGMAAIHLEMPKRIPRTEYSAELYYDLVQTVTGLSISSGSTSEEKHIANQAFRKAWNYDFNWNIMVDATYAFREQRSRMGHAQFIQGGEDYTTERSELFQNPEDVLAFDPFEMFGTIDITHEAIQFSNNYHQRKTWFPDEVNMTGIYISCISGLIDLFGWDMLLYSAGVNASAFGEMTLRYHNWIRQYFLALAQSEADVVMIHDDMVWTEGPFIHPDWYRKYVFPEFKKNIQLLRDYGKKVMFTCDGNFNAFIEDIAQSGVHGFVMEPITSLETLAERYGQTHVLVGNADTRILLFGSKQDIHDEVRRCMNIGKDCPGFFMAIGNHISSNCPLDRLLYYNECYEKYAIR